MKRAWPITLAYTLAALALFGQLLIYVDYAAALFRFPFDYDQGEGFELYDTVLHTQGQWPYRDSQTFANQFYTSIYPPFFHLMVAPLVMAFGPQLWTGRAVGFALSLLAAAGVGWGVYRASGHRRIALLSGLTFIASNYTFHIGPLFRQHMAMVAFETLAVIALAELDRGLAQARGWRRQPRLWAGLLLLLVAGYTKQLAIATVVAALGYLFLRGPRRALFIGLGLSAVAGGVFLWLNVATNGWWHTSIIRANINAYDLRQTIEFYKQWSELHLLILIVAAARLVYETYFSRLSIYALWFAVTVANGALSGKFGAGESYFVTATAATCVLSGIALAHLLKRASQWSPRPGLAVGLAIPLLYLAQTRLNLHLPTTGPIYGPLAQVLGVNHPSGYYDSQGYTQLGPHPTEADAAAGWEIVRRAQAAPCPATGTPDHCPIFSEEAALMFRAGKPVFTKPFPQLVMYQAGLFDPREEIELINQQAFGLVIFRAQFYPPPVLAAVWANYEQTAVIKLNGFRYLILEPKGDD
jgi:hypothetical protein